MAYRTVKPYALGNARHASADLERASREYAYRGVPEATSMHDCASSGVRKLEEVAGVARRRVELGVLNFLVGAKALAEDAIAIKMAKLARDALMVQMLRVEGVKKWRNDGSAAVD
jgi:hypothetical protein